MGGSSIVISSLRSAHKKALATAVYDGFLSGKNKGISSPYDERACNFNALC